jgi:hypothetical protein
VETDLPGFRRLEGGYASESSVGESTIDALKLGADIDQLSKYRI